jgi:hypothetical protein
VCCPSFDLFSSHVAQFAYDGNSATHRESSRICKCEQCDGYLTARCCKLNWWILVRWAGCSPREAARRSAGSTRLLISSKGHPASPRSMADWSHYRRTATTFDPTNRPQRHLWGASAPHFFSYPVDRLPVVRSVKRKDAFCAASKDGSTVGTTSNDPHRRSGKQMRSTNNHHDVGLQLSS